MHKSGDLEVSFIACKVIEDFLLIRIRLIVVVIVDKVPKLVE
jgi:hypothetical protein